MTRRDALASRQIPHEILRTTSLTKYDVTSPGFCCLCQKFVIQRHRQKTKTLQLGSHKGDSERSVFRASYETNDTDVETWIHFNTRANMLLHFGMRGESEEYREFA